MTSQVGTSKKALPSSICRIGNREICTKGATHENTRFLLSIERCITVYLALDCTVFGCRTEIQGQPLHCDTQF